MRRELIHLGHGKSIDGAGFDTISAEHTLGDINVKFCGIPLKGKGFIFFTNDLNTSRGTGDFTEITPYASFLAVLIA